MARLIFWWVFVLVGVVVGAHKVLQGEFWSGVVVFMCCFILAALARYSRH